MKDFVHLRAHSAYSLAKSMLKIEDMISLAKANSMNALAICDEHNLFGSLEFSEYAVKKGLKPIIGVQLRAESPFGYGEDEICIYAKNDAGLSNLIKIVSDSYTNRPDFSKPPIVTYNQLIQNKEGIILLSGFEKGSVGKLLLQNHEKDAAKFAGNIAKSFDGHFYIEITRQDDDLHDFEEKMINLAYDQHIPLVATHPVFYPQKSAYEAFDALNCIANGEYIDAEHRKKPNPEKYFKTKEEMNELFSDLPEALDNTANIAIRCTARMKSRQPMLPKFSDDQTTSEDEIFANFARDGLRDRLKVKKEIEKISDVDFINVTKEYFDRLEFEINVITSMKFSGYFLIVSDFMIWAKKNDVPVGPGRGSGAGSLVAWSLQITNLDPIRFGLLFERFLNPERVSMPDFDIDFCQEKREKVINYVKEKYGEERVAQIITFGKLQARAVIRDVGRTMQMPLPQVDRISKMVPNNPANPVNLSQAIELEPNLREAINNDPQVKKLIDIALQLEGLYRHTSVHAAGIVIADQNLVNVAPLYRDDNSDMQSVQFSMKYAEMAGLVKFDFLGLKTLTVIKCALDLLKDQGIVIDIDNISFDNPDAYKMLSNGESVGVFQFESKGMQDALRKLKPDTIEDLIALGALYRPGPMDNIPTYIARKHGLEEPDYIHPTLEGILKETFGVIIYQEQVMQIAQVLSGYSLGGADLLRRAMGKKIKAEMDAQRDLFVNGAKENGIDPAFASEVFDLVAKFAGYGFNKSHAAAYAVIAYQTAFLKANYTAEFLIASLNYDIDDTDKIMMFIQEAKKFGITVLPPDVNKSQAVFSLEIDNEGTKYIRYGLSALKNVGRNVADSIAIARGNKPFKSLEDFAQRVPSEALNKRVIEGFAKSGTMDNFVPNRRKLFENAEIIAKSSSGSINTSQISLFGSQKQQNNIELVEFEDWPFTKRLALENEAFGFYFSDHPLKAYQYYLDKYKFKDYKYIQENLEKSGIYKLAVVPSELRMRVSNKGRFGYLMVSDQTFNYDIAVFEQDLLDAKRSVMESELPLYITVEARKDEGGIRLTAQDIDFLDKFLINQSQMLLLETANIDLINYLKKCEANDGIKVKLKFLNKNQLVTMDLGSYFNPSVFDLELIRENITDVKIEFVE
ncbi:MAG: DNA polymerase III subunit alpha [Alphaproteobacteria bacterium 33-17]|nr:MAG: DNA polymerase III subunit alpha [Alphaproteobacteria bacterium 33-17]